MNKLISFEQALTRIAEVAKGKSPAFLARTELKKLSEASGRFCAEDVFARESVPHFNNSSMDGFAVRSEETLNVSKFVVRGRILAGDAPLLKVDARPLSCYEIMTGAPIPEGYDAVYKVEDVEVEKDFSDTVTEIQADRALERFENYRHQGADFAVGDKILHARTLLMPEHIMALASVGVSELRVLRRPKVAVLSTGSELCDPSESILVSGKIRNSTSSYLVSALPHFGAEVKYYGSVRDERDAYVLALENILGDQPDVIITTGAVSKGSHDFIPEVIQKMGAKVFFHNTAIRPGKPQLFGAFSEGGPVFFGIPGNPISTAVGLRFFVGAYLRGLSGLSAESPVSASLSEEVEKPLDLRCFFKARLELSSSGAQVTSLAGQPSFIVSSLLQANAWVVFQEEMSIVPAGAQVSVYPLYPPSYDYSTEHPRNTGDSNAESCCGGSH